MTGAGSAEQGMSEARERMTAVQARSAAGARAAHPSHPERRRAKIRLVFTGIYFPTKRIMVMEGTLNTSRAMTIADWTLPFTQFCMTSSIAIRVLSRSLRFPVSFRLIPYISVKNIPARLLAPKAPA
jgi:hypothetical protein